MSFSSPLPQWSLCALDHVNDVNAYLEGKTTEERGVTSRKNRFCACIFHPEQQAVRFLFTELQLGQTLREKASSVFGPSLLYLPSWTLT